MTAMRSSLVLMVGALALVGCDAALNIDPEGYRCDIGASCPAGYVCQATTGTCTRGMGMDPSCAGVVCNAPPATTCANGNTTRTFVGRCIAGQCQYDPVDMTCATTCDQGACVDACAGVSCVTPPGATCVSGTTLRTFGQTGTCANGTCDYAQTDTTCPNGCAMGACSGVNLCTQNNVMCNMPPATACVGNVRRTFMAMGTCAPGTGMCTYQPNDMTCPSGCSAGQCLTPALTLTQLGPRLKFAVNALDLAPGSSGAVAVAVGNSGKLARWDGTTWTEAMTPTMNKFTAVSFVNGSTAYAVGAGGTALTVRNNSLNPIAFPATTTQNLVAVSGRGDQEAMIVSETGTVFRQRNGNWSSGGIDAGTAPFAMTGAYLDESLRERVIGTCNGNPCVAYRNLPNGGQGWSVQQRGSIPYSALGGGFDIPTSATVSVAFLGTNLDVITHDTTGFVSGTFFNSIATTPALSGQAIVGLTAQAVTLNRDVYALTSSSGSPNGHLYRVTRGVTQNTAVDALTTFYGEEHLSANDSGGVLVAEVRRTSNVNNVFRRGPVTNEALDVGEDFIGASADSALALYFIGIYGDLAIKRPNQSTFDFRRPPSDTWGVHGFDARNGTGVLIVGEDINTNEALISRYSAGTFTPITTVAGEVFNAVCRVSDTEAWAVGTGGIIYRLSGTTATAVTSPTTDDLLAVDCAANAAVACGKNGTVLRFGSNTWQAVTPALPTTNSATTCKLVPGGGLVGGDNFLYSFANGAWTMLQGKVGLRTLTVRSPTDVYGTFVTTAGQSEVARFDGTAWSNSLLSVTGELGGGVQVGARVVWGGTLGAIVEGR